MADLSEMFGGGEFDAQGHVKTSGVMPAGKYRAVIVESETQPSKAGHPMLKMKLQILSPPEFANRIVFDYLSLGHPNNTVRNIALDRLKDYALACGVVKLKESSALHNRAFEVELKVDDSGENKSNQVKRISKIGPASIAIKAASTAGKSETDPF